MKISFIFELLLIFVFLAFAASAAVIESARKTSSKKHNKSAQKRQGPTNSTANRFCSCSMRLCNCCREFNIPVVPLRGPGCATLQYLKGDRLAISMSFGDRVLTNTTISSRKPQPICMPLPGGVSKFCGRVYNIGREGDEFNACLGLELRALNDIEAALRVSCFRFGPKGLRLEPPQPLPVLEEDEEDDDDDDDYDDFSLDDSDNYGSFGILDDDFIGGYFQEESTSSKKKSTTTTTKAPLRRVTRKPVKPVKVQQKKPLRTKATPKPTTQKKTIKTKATTTTTTTTEKVTVDVSANEIQPNTTGHESISSVSNVLKDTMEDGLDEKITAANYSTLDSNLVITESMQETTESANQLDTKLESTTIFDTTTNTATNTEPPSKTEDEDDSDESDEDDDEDPISEVVSEVLDEEEESTENLEKPVHKKTHDKKEESKEVLDDIMDSMVGSFTGEESDESDKEDDDDDDDDDDDSRRFHMPTKNRQSRDMRL